MSTKARLVGLVVTLALVFGIVALSGALDKEAIRDRFDGDVPQSDVPVLTDDYAPTDALLLLFD